MTKREEITGWINRYLTKRFICDPGKLPEDECEREAKDILRYLDDNDVVIKVERELPETPYDSFGDLPAQFDSDETATDMDVFLMHCYGIEKGKRLMLKWHNDSLEPLIEGGK